MTIETIQIFHRETRNAAVGRDLDQKYELASSLGRGSTGCGGDGVQMYVRSEVLKRRSAQMDHRIGSAKKEPRLIRLDLRNVER